MTITTTEWNQLNAGCIYALEDFNEEAERTCRLLAGIRNFPMSVEERSLLAQQRSAENAAYHCYLERRLRLCQLAVD